MTKNEPLSTVFPCLFCNHEKSVTAKIDKKAGVGMLACKVCGQKFQCGINCMYTYSPVKLIAASYTFADHSILVDLSAPVDVYSDWVDACEAVEQENKGELLDTDAYTHSPQRATAKQAAPAKSKNDYNSDDDDDADIMGNEDGFGGGGYSGDGIVADDEDY